jgi:hypothetical protein
MIYPYGATVIWDRSPEGVVCNRDSFCKFCCRVDHPLHVQNMSRYLGDDGIYGGLRGQLQVPFDLTGMNDAAPSISFPSSGTGT